MISTSVSAKARTTQATAPPNSPKKWSGSGATSTPPKPPKPTKSNRPKKPSRSSASPSPIATFSRQQLPSWAVFTRERGDDGARSRDFAGMARWSGLGNPLPEDVNRATESPLESALTKKDGGRVGIWLAFETQHDPAEVTFPGSCLEVTFSASRWRVGNGGLRAHPGLGVRAKEAGDVALNVA